jgi:hypothetical protein
MVPECRPGRITSDIHISLCPVAVSRLEQITKGNRGIRSQFIAAAIREKLERQGVVT